MKPLNAIAIIRVNTRLPILPWGWGLVLSLKPSCPFFLEVSQLSGGQGPKEGCSCPLVGAFLLGF